LATLLRDFRSAADPAEFPLLGTRIRAITAARTSWLNADFITSAPDPVFRAAVRDFYCACVRSGWHADVIDRHADRLRRGATQFLDAPTPAARRLDECLVPGGALFVPGLGPAFWSAVLQALSPGAAPAWTPDVVAGLARLAMWLPGAGAAPAVFYAALSLAYAEIRRQAPGMTSFQIDEFLTRHGLCPLPATVDRWVNQHRTKRGRGRLTFAAGRGLARLDDAIARAPAAQRCHLAEQAVQSFAAAHGLSRAGAVAVLEAVAEDGPAPAAARTPGAEIFAASWFRRRINPPAGARRPAARERGP
jgi:hypothetical protein